jgi:8-oxo-dGTP pyrophosphatase MutT (NUDIX family)
VRDRPGVIVYVTRAAPADWELLLFDVPDDADYRAIVPGGGIEPGELPQDAAAREVMEETGLEVHLLGELGVDGGTHFFHAAPAAPAQDEWMHDGVRCYWEPLRPGLRVWGARGDLLARLRRARVLAYITRDTDRGRELLVFEQPGDPDAGVQVPAGRLDPGENLVTGLLREIAEEAGLDAVRIVRELPGFESHYESRYDNHGFHVVVDGETPDEWEHVVFGDGDDAGLTFSYRWAPIEPELELFGRRHPGLPVLLDG